MSGAGGVSLDKLRALAERAVYPSYGDFADADAYLLVARGADRARRQLENVLVDDGALLGLLGRVAAAEAERDALREFAAHKPLCQRIAPATWRSMCGESFGRCTCGLDAVLAASVPSGPAAGGDT